MDKGIDPQGPYLHAMIVGVGEYPYWNDGIHSLTSPVKSASAFAKWLLQGYHHRFATLGSVEILISGARLTPAEDRGFAVFEPTMANIRAAFQRWRARCHESVENIAVFYFCGHGFEREVRILLAQDFLEDQSLPSANAIDFDTTYRSLVACRASTQFYFIDACREPPGTGMFPYRTPGTPLWESPPGAFFPRAAPIYLSSPRGRPAFGEPDEVSYFTTALLSCLGGFGAGYRDGNHWIVTAESLATAMHLRLADMVLPDGRRGACSVEGERVLPAEFHYQVPPASVRLRIRGVPARSFARTALYVSHSGSKHSERAPAPEPWNLDVLEGKFQVAYAFAGQREAPESGTAHPPLSIHTLELPS